MLSNNQSLKTRSTLQPQLIKWTARIIGNPTARANILSNQLTATSDIKVEVGSSVPFKGDYEYTPTQQTQEIGIKGFTATQDIIINPIPSNYGRIEYDGSTLRVI